MTAIHRSALVSYSAHQMFDLVADIDSYSAFLPWCSGSRVLAREPDGMTASIDIAYGGVHKSFTTRNRVQPGKMLEMRLVNGPFRHLFGLWAFHPLEDQGCRVTLDLEFEFASPMIAFVLKPVFTGIANDLVDSFHRRATEVYGGPR